MFNERSFGFTFVELLVSISIFVVAAIFVIVSLSSYLRKQALEINTGIIAEEISSSQLKASLGKNDSSHGIHFSSSSLVHYIGTTYNPADLTNSTTTIDSRVLISTVELNGGGANMTFDKLTGQTSNFGTITVILLTDSVEANVLVVSPTGNITKQ